MDVLFHDLNGAAYIGLIGLIAVLLIHHYLGGHDRYGGPR